MDVDVAIVGAGPAGLCLAKALEPLGQKLVLIEAHAKDAVSAPAFDGREIALTHRSIEILKKLDIWQRIPPDQISRLVDARVRNGDSPQSLIFSHHDSGVEELGLLVPNHCIRQAAWNSVSDSTNSPAFVFDDKLTGLESHKEGYRLQLASGSMIHTSLLVAADSRFSETRRMLGIRARMHDFGKTMLVARVEHDADHQHVAQEWFQYGSTVALLPLNGRQSSVVITRTAPQITKLMQMDKAAFAREMEAATQGQLGHMTLASSRHAYPLVGTWSQNFVSQNAALVGDAAVGMHPVTAHGFNLGLVGVDLLARQVQTASLRERKQPTAIQLRRYESELRRAAFPLFMGTNAVVRLFTDDRPPAQFARGALLQMAELAAPFRKLVSRSLSAT